jgi:hypothetical protein
MRTPWLDERGRSVFDVCSADGGGGSLLGGGVPARLTCSRTEARYYAYGGQSHKAMQSLKKVLRRLGWDGFTAVPPVGTQGPLPQVTASVGPHLARPPAGLGSLKFSWADRIGQFSPERDLGAVPALVAPRFNTYLQALRPDFKLITRGTDHVLIVALTMDYVVKPG